MYSGLLIAKYLCCLRYDGSMLEENVFEKAIEEGAASPGYTGLVQWATSELKNFHELENNVNAVSC